jgi:hypothetical protein
MFGWLSVTKYFAENELCFMLLAMALLNSAIPMSFTRRSQQFSAQICFSIKFKYEGILSKIEKYWASSSD